MKSSARLRLVFCVLAVLLVTGILAGVYLRKDEGKEGGRSAVAGAALTLHAVADRAAVAPSRSREDFTGLPPGERINAETKRSVEESAAWREKLRSGDQTNLPPEAYPPGVPQHSSPAGQ